MSTNTMPWRKQMMSRVTSEARAAKTFVASAWGAHHLNQEQFKTERTLAPIETEIGAKAEMANVAAGLPAMEDVRMARAQIAEAEKVVIERRAAVAAAEERLQAAAQVNAKAKEALSPEHQQRSAAAEAASAQLQAARAELATLEKAVRKAEAKMNVPAPAGMVAPGEAAPPMTVNEEARAELARLAEARGPIEARVAAAREAYDAAAFAAGVKAAEVDRMDRAWKHEEGDLTTAVAMAERELTDAVEVVAERRAVLDEAHRELGRAVCEAGIRAEPLMEPLEKAAPLMKQSHEAAATAAELRVRAAYTRIPAMHVAIAAGIAMVVIVALLVTLIVSLWH